MQRLFHYTTIVPFKKILESGEIKTATLYIDKGEKPVVWCSYHPHWEPTAMPADVTRPNHQLTFDELLQIQTPVRIVVDPAATPLNWHMWRKTSGVKSKTVKGLEISALRCNANIKDWRMSFDPIKVKNGHWLDIEIFTNGQWIQLPRHD